LNFTKFFRVSILNKMLKEKSVAYWSLGIVLLLLIILSLVNTSTGDSGDSIMHFLYARYAYVHPEFFLNHWAKPIFVLLGAPFAQFGFIGIKIFNSILAVLTAYFTYLTCIKLNIRNPLVSILIIFFSPLFSFMIFSGVTHYLFAFVLILSIFLTMHKKIFAAVLIVSFLPFIRSEGLLIIGTFALYLLVIKKFKYLPLLLAGHLVYGLVGYFHYGTVLWVFTEIPYANLESPYGTGGLFDFFHRLNYVVEKPIYILLIAGVLFVILTFFRKDLINKRELYAEELILIYGSFGVYFIAHTLFWWKGLFNSMGLPRVLIDSIPLIGIIALNGFNFITHPELIKNRKLNLSFKIIVLVIIVIYPFTYRVEGVNWYRDLGLNTENLLIKEELKPFISDKYPKRKLYYQAPYISLALNHDYFNPEIHEEMYGIGNSETIEEGSLIIWDDWFTFVQCRIGKDLLFNNQDYKHIITFQRQDDERFIQFIIFEKKGGG